MQLRSGRYVIAPQSQKTATETNKPDNNKPATETNKPPTTPLTMLANVAVVRSIFNLLDKYNNLIKDHEINYMKLCEILPNDSVRENRIKNLENTWILDNARIRTEMVSIVKENFDMISEVVPPFMLYGIVMDARNIYDKFNAYKHEYPMIEKHFKMKNSVDDVDRVLDILLNEIDDFDEQFTEFIVGSAAQSRLYSF
jgi:hypothetical protein